MKTITIVVLVLILGCVLAVADTQVRLALDTAALINGEPTFAAVYEGFAERSNLLRGLHWELVHDHLGFGGHALVRFDQQPGVVEPYQWSMDWDGDLFMSVHLNRVGRFFDPFLELGFGAAGRVFLDDHGDGTWVQDECGLWHYVSNTATPNQGLASLSLYPYVAGGLALDLHGLMVGTRVCYRPWNEPVPCAQIPVYGLAPVQVTVFGGLALGGHHRGGHR